MGTLACWSRFIALLVVWPVIGPLGLAAGDHSASSLMPVLERRSAAVVQRPATPRSPAPPAEKGGVDATVEAEIRQVMHDWRDAKVRHDLEALDRLMTSDFVEINQVDDRSDRKQILALYASKDLVFSSIDILTVKLKMVGHDVRATGTQVESVTFRGRPVGGRLTFAETYVKRGAAWQILKSSLDR